ncbi:MAG TPA: SIR2 family protein, partial [Cytophagales bacterium]|nr:SIR2 family protein [Cytophagales bacterium]
VSVYRDAIEKLRDRNRNASAEGKHRAQQIANAVDLDTWWDYQLKADAETDADKAEIWYRKGLAKFPDSARLLGSYALFLNVNQREYDQAEAYYQKALAIDSEDEIFLGSYAFFLHEIRKDYNQAEEYYQKALAIDSENNIFLVSYAIFLHEIRREYDQAEEYYQKALKINPKHVISLVSYAIFLHQIRKKYDQAEAYFQKALAIDPDHANNLGNYAQLKLCQGKLEEGKKLMDQSFDKATEADTMLELWFYRAAHFPEYYEEGLQELEERVANGDRSPAWDFSCQLKAAEENSHPYLERLRELAETITSVEE